MQWTWVLGAIYVRARREIDTKPEIQSGTRRKAKGEPIRATQVNAYPHRDGRGAAQHQDAQPKSRVNILLLQLQPGFIQKRLAVIWQVACNIQSTRSVVVKKKIRQAIP